MDTPIQSSQLDEGQGVLTSPPQVTETPEQSGSQPQPSNPAQVENGTNQQSQGQPQNASDYETARHIKRLERSIRSMQQAFEKSQQSVQQNGVPQPPVSKVTQDELLKDPLGTIQRLMDERDQRLKGEIPKSFEQYSQANRYEQARQEGLKMIKSNEAIKRDPNGEERIKEILLEEDENGNSLEQYAQQNPSHAARLALDIYKSRHGQRNGVSAPTKSQMSSTATSVTSGSKGSTLDQEAAQLQREFMSNPQLMQDKDFFARMKAFETKARIAGMEK